MKTNTGRLELRGRGRRVTLAVAAVVVAAATALSALAAAGTFSSSGDPNWPQEKQARQQQAAARQAAARAHAVAKPVIPPAGPPARLPAREGGLIRGLGQGPFSPTEFQSNSTWQGAVGGVWIQVYAGADVTGSAPVGELRLYSMPIDPNDGPTTLNALGSAASPKEETSLSLVGVTGHVLTVSAPSGDRFTFDVATRRWGG